MPNSLNYTFLILAALLITATCSYGQKKIIEAYIVLANNDTVQGVLNLQKENERLRSISFKPENASNFTSYGAAQIQAYGIRDSLLFVSREVKAEDLQQFVFVKVLVKGPVSLYITDNLSSEGDFYLQKTEGQLINLKKRHFLGELSYLLSDCPSFKVDTKSARKLKYTEEKLAATIHNYNNCVYPEAASKIMLTTRQLFYRFGLKGGSQVGQISFEADNAINQTIYNERVPFVAVAMAGVFVTMHEAHKPLALQAELLVKRYNLNYATDKGGGQQLRYTRSVNFKTNVVQMPLLLQYKFPVKLKAQPFFYTGPACNYIINTDLVLGFEYSDTHKRKRTEHVADFALTYIAGAGVQHRLSDRHRLIIDLRYSLDFIKSYHVDPFIREEPRNLTVAGLQITTGVTL